MASFDEAFNFPLTNKLMLDKEKSNTNVFARGSYVTINAETYKEKNSVSELSMYNREFSLKEYKQS